ncbi:MAG: hypothetical protein F6K54_01545 [Okeania sp. SIO3B5]|uniref:hypothetical protein n=1 Tax=Okeania sp. SIO3B5 TaxID=2607811 RepID=UPI001400F719|nr:hypothetical protein [Okeania sp. SIO3B5]NEO51886.1 hypothetical protein [Okeania sp. SIO3B5]
MKNKRTYAIPGGAKIEKFGELLLWDEKVKRFVQAIEDSHIGGDVNEYFGLTPNIYAIHPAMYRNRHFAILSVTDFQLSTEDFRSTVIVFRHRTKLELPEKVQEGFSSAVLGHIKTSIDRIGQDIVAGSLGAERKIPYSASVMTMEALMLEQSKS